MIGWVKEILKQVGKLSVIIAFDVKDYKDRTQGNWRLLSPTDLVV